jgi:hypothetical protein
MDEIKRIKRICTDIVFSLTALGCSPGQIQAFLLGFQSFLLKTKPSSQLLSSTLEPWFVSPRRPTLTDDNPLVWETWLDEQYSGLVAQVTRPRLFDALAEPVTAEPQPIDEQEWASLLEGIFTAQGLDISVVPGTRQPRSLATPPYLPSDFDPVVNHHFCGSPVYYSDNGACSNCKLVVFDD